MRWKSKSLRAAGIILGSFENSCRANQIARKPELCVCLLDACLCDSMRVIAWNPELELEKWL